LVGLGAEEHRLDVLLPGLSTDRTAKELSTLPQGRGLRGSVL
jgi:hypothetical protein